MDTSLPLLARRNFARSFVITLIKVSSVARKTFRVKKARRREKNSARNGVLLLARVSIIEPT